MIARNSIPPDRVPRLRVGIYTRQSVSDGEQEFGSVQAQRECIENHIQSQRTLGWEASPELYNDTNATGANTDRPAFQRLLKDVAAGTIQIVAVYKIDRLSRSLLDFTSTLRFFEDHNVAFVSVTQQFSTATSVGRMVMNILATFAQFERESISERTRDKMRAARKRGMYTGGRPTLGFDNIDGKLVVNPAEAERVREVFQLYLQLGSLGALVKELNLRGWTLKSYKTQDGRDVVGGAFNRTNLQYFLRNAVFAGKQRCGDDLVAGQHEAIVDVKTFDAVQAALDSRNRAPDRDGRYKREVLLRGLLVCEKCGKGWTYHVTSKKGGQSNAYYECATYQKRGASACPGSRASAAKLEAAVVAEVACRLREKRVLRDTLRAARESVVTRTGDLERELKRLRREQGRTASEAVAAQIASTEAELAMLASLELDERDLAECFENFDDLWSELFISERVRLLQLLVEKIAIDTDAETYQIKFREGTRNARAIEGVA